MRSSMAGFPAGVRRAWLAAFVVAAALGIAAHQTAAGGAVAHHASADGDGARLEVPHFSLRDLIADEEEFADTEFIVLSQQEQAQAQAQASSGAGGGAQAAATEREFEVHAHGNEAFGAAAARDHSASGSGVVCETVCRPRVSPATVPPSTGETADASFLELVNDDDKLQGSGTTDIAALQRYVRKVVDGMQQSHAAQVEELALSFNRSLCQATGGGWDSAHAVCAPFMRASAAAVAACDGDGVFEACAGAFVDGDGVAQSGGGAAGDYVPCNPFQALALAHTQQQAVPQQAYFWLWAGGRADQVDSAVFKQDIGHNPAEGLDRCAEGERIGMFHNWDANHVDSWSCLDCSHELPVLCCRR